MIKIRGMSAMLLSSLSIAVSAAGPGDSQPNYRDGQPAVASAPAERVDDSAERAAASLRSALQASSNPRFVLMWNRQLSDGLVTEYESFRQTITSAEVDTAPSSVAVITESRNLTRAVKERESSALPQDDDWLVRGAFESWLLGAGMNLVDRTTVLRQAGIKLDSDQPNAQKIEMEAIGRYADYILEVLSTPARGPAGARFRVRVTSVKAGRTVVGFSSIGAGSQRVSTRFVAGDSGFKKVAEVTPTSTDEVGANIAIELAQQLSAVLKR